MSLQPRKRIYQNYNSSLPPFSSNNGNKIVSIAIAKNKEIAELELPFENCQPNSLPTAATANDVRELVRFLRHFPDGVTTQEFMDAEPRRIFDARKIAAYEYWKIVKTIGNRVQLTDLGLEMAKSIEPEKNVFYTILRSAAPYITAAEWIAAQQLKIVTHFEVVNFWRQAHPDLQIASQDEKEVEAMVVSFFSLCHNAEIGTMTIGKRGQPARLRIDFDRLDSFLLNKSDVDSLRYLQNNVSNILSLQNNFQRVYLSTNKQYCTLSQLQEILELADFHCIISNADCVENNFIARSQLSIMSQCSAGVFLINEENCDIGSKNTFLNNQTLIEINSAATLYDWRVVICWLSKNQPPVELLANKLTFIQSEILDWQTNFKLVQNLKNMCFK